jgi:hypothetical protein
MGDFSELRQRELEFQRHHLLFLSSSFNQPGRFHRATPALKTQKPRQPINLASGPSKTYEVWRLELSAHAHVPHSRQFAGQQRNVIEATFIKDNLYEAT